MNRLGWRLLAYGGIAVILTVLGYQRWSSIPWSVVISPLVCIPGQTVEIELEGPGVREDISCLFGAERYPFYKSPSACRRALVPIPADHEPGHVLLRIIQERRFGGPKTFLARLRILPCRTRIQRIRLSKKTRSLYSHPDVATARETFSSALLDETPDRLWNGRFILPLRSVITSRFGMRRISSLGRKSYHRGIDFKAARGTPVPAANDGIVSVAGAFPLHGKAVAVGHGQGVMSTYLHLSRMLVKKGERVRKGQLVGEAGSTGISTGPHLHWGVFLHGVPVNPMEWTEREF